MEITLYPRSKPEDGMALKKAIGKHWKTPLNQLASTNVLEVDYIYCW